MLRSSSKTRSQYLVRNKRGSPRASDKRSTSTSFSAKKSAPKSKGRTGSPATEAFSHQELIELKESFQMFDPDEDGNISLESFRTVLEVLLEEKDQPYPYLEEILRLLSDMSDDETIDFDAYLELMASTSLPRRLQTQQGEDGEPDFQHVFDLFDVDGKGYITVDDLREVALELGEDDMTMDELQEMVDRACSRKTGKVTLKEFSKMMTLNLFQKAETTTKSDYYQDEPSAQDEN